MSKYDIDFPEQIRQTLPVELRKKKMKAWLKSLCQPAAWIYGLFLAAKADVLYEMEHNGQVCRLRKLLNDRFDNTDRRIYLEDVLAILSVYFLRRLEAKPVYFRRRSENMPVYMRRRSEMTFGGSFIVKVPAALVFNEDEMKALIDKYKLAGKSYTIELF